MFDCLVFYNFIQCLICLFILFLIWMPKCMFKYYKSYPFGINRNSSLYSTHEDFGNANDLFIASREASKEI